jgi:nicotinate-nucleotide pyrophosphorylase (carboxylating)
MDHSTPALWTDLSSDLGEQLLHQGLVDDGWQWDWTALGSLQGKSAPQITARIVAKSDGVWAGDSLVIALRKVSTELGSPIRVDSKVVDSTRLKKGELCMTWTGSARIILALERPFLNLAAYMGGIAYQTRRLVDQVNGAWQTQYGKKGSAEGVCPRVTATRKTLPGYRDLAVHAVICGGGYSHRVSLAGGVLIKENHIASAGGIAEAIRGCKAVAPHGLKCEVEVRNMDELKQAVNAGGEGVLLDNFTPAQIKEAVKFVRGSGKPVFIEASGGLNEENISGYVIDGVNILSSGSLTHSVKAIDLSLLVPND